MRAQEVARDMVRTLFGIILGFVLVPIALLAWLQFGPMPVAVHDPPIPHERMIAHIPLEARIHREMVKTAPFQVDEDSMVAGAQIYRDQCAVCHGFHGKPSALGAQMFPEAPPLWEKHPNGDVVGVSDDPPGETYWKVANGIRLTGMPAFQGTLNDKQMWQVSLLLSNADKLLPPPVVDILRGQPPAPPPTATPAAGAKKTAQPAN
jgi:mono/diheme cytochrome c family protein